MDLHKIWLDLTARYSANKTLIKKLWTEIENSYASESRHYHNLNHVHFMMDKAFEYESELNDPDTVMFSIFYHDIVYDVKHTDNEQNSAGLAKWRLTELGVQDAKITKCVQQIVSTCRHQETSDNDTNFFLDFDLAILGASSEIYNDYKKKIRNEYSIYPEIVYREGRKKVVQDFLAMNRIFKTDALYRKFESQARINLEGELKEL